MPISLIVIAAVILFLVASIFFYFFVDLREFKIYRKFKKGTWYLVSYTYKIDVGMTRVNAQQWTQNESFYKTCDNFKLIKTEKWKNSV